MDFYLTGQALVFCAFYIVLGYVAKTAVISNYKRFYTTGPRILHSEENLNYMRL